MKRSIGLLVLSTIGIFIAGPALADRKPTHAERSQIESRLRQLGFKSWEDIELDDDSVWEVDDARMHNGHKYDLKLQHRTLKVLERDRD